MAARYQSNDTEDVPTTQDSVPLDLVPLEHPIPEGDNELSDEYWDETDTHHPLTELLEHFWQLKDQCASLKFTTLQPTPRAGLMQLKDKLQHLTKMLQPASQPSEEPAHKTMPGVHRHLVCDTERIKPHHNHAARYPCI